jgi:hypothetical protein
MPGQSVRAELSLLPGSTAWWFVSGARVGTAVVDRHSGKCISVGVPALVCLLGAVPVAPAP